MVAGGYAAVAKSLALWTKALVAGEARAQLGLAAREARAREAEKAEADTVREAVAAALALFGTEDLYFLLRAVCKHEARAHPERTPGARRTGNHCQHSRWL